MAAALFPLRSSYNLHYGVPSWKYWRRAIPYKDVFELYSNTLPNTPLTLSWPHIIVPHIPVLWIPIHCIWIRILKFYPIWIRIPFHTERNNQFWTFLKHTFKTNFSLKNILKKLTKKWIKKKFLKIQIHKVAKYRYGSNLDPDPHHPHTLAQMSPYITL